MFKFQVFVELVFVLGCQGQTPSQSYPFMRQLDTEGNVLLNWDFNTTYITLELHAKTTGWIGVGISPNGDMAGADMIVGWVKSGQVTITDRFATGNLFPPMDNEQNIYDLSGGERDGWTWIKFTRQLPACDSLQDLPITEDTMRIIYAFGTTDPVGDDIVSSDYHGTNRGTRLTLFTETADMNSVASPPEETIETFNLTTGGVTLPPRDTFYSCHLLQLPDVPSKRHIIEISPLIQSGNERYISHIIVYQCVDPLPAGAVVGSSGECFTDSEPISDNDCSITFTGWAAGAENLRYPSNVGLPFGEPGDSRNIRLQIHYDNPNLDEGVIDNSGLTIKYTSQLRTHDAGLLHIGATVFPYVFFIPPNAESFLAYGDCPADCLEKAMDYGNITSFTIFATLFQTHSLGRKVTVRHFSLGGDVNNSPTKPTSQISSELSPETVSQILDKSRLITQNGAELPFVTKDDAYDFNFNAYRYVQPERVVLPGDQLQVLCDYDSTSRTNITYGGLPRTRERCYGFVSYYPRLPISRCLSGPIPDPYIYNALGINNISDIRAPPSSELTFTGSYAQFYFEGSNLTLEQYFNDIPWDQELAAELSNNLNEIPKFQVCTNNDISPPGLASFVLPANITQPYVEPNPTCIETTTTNTTTTTPPATTTISATTTTATTTTATVTTATTTTATTTTASTTTVMGTTSGQNGITLMSSTYQLFVLIILSLIIGDLQM